MTGARKVSGTIIAVVCLLIGVFFCGSMEKSGFSTAGLMGAAVGLGGAVFCVRRLLQGSAEDEDEETKEEDDSEW